MNCVSTNRTQASYFVPACCVLKLEVDFSEEQEVQETIGPLADMVFSICTPALLSNWKETTMCDHS